MKENRTSGTRHRTYQDKHNMTSENNEVYEFLNTLSADPDYKGIDEICNSKQTQETIRYGGSSQMPVNFESRRSATRYNTPVNKSIIRKTKKWLNKDSLNLFIDEIDLKTTTETVSYTHLTLPTTPYV